MSKKDYCKIAKEYNALWNDPEWKYYTTQNLFETMVDKLATVFLADNPGFDRDKFMDAIYGEKRSK